MVILRVCLFEAIWIQFGSIRGFLCIQVAKMNRVSNMDRHFWPTPLPNGPTLAQEQSPDLGILWGSKVKWFVPYKNHPSISQSPPHSPTWPTIASKWPNIGPRTAPRSGHFVGLEGERVRALQKSPLHQPIHPNIAST